MSKPDYPQTRRVDQVDPQFGVQVADPYRWLENDVRKDPEVAAWVAAQNKVTDAYLATLPGRDIFKERLTRADRLRAVRRAGEEGRQVFLHAAMRGCRTSRRSTSAKR